MGPGQWQAASNQGGEVLPIAQSRDPRTIDRAEFTSQLEEKKEKAGQETPTRPHPLNLSRALPSMSR